VNNAELLVTSTVIPRPDPEIFDSLI